MADKIEHEQAELMSDKPPLAITPRGIAILGWASDRKYEIEETILQYIKHGYAEIPIEWVEEYNDLVQILRNANKPRTKTIWEYRLVTEDAKPSYDPPTNQ